MITTSENKPKINKHKNYLNKKDLLTEINKSRAQDELTPNAVKMLMLLAQRTIGKLYYKCEDDKQHALSEAYYDLVKNWRKFDPDFARLHGYENLKQGDEIKVYLDKNLDTTTSATVIENNPIEKLIESVKQDLIRQDLKLIDIVHDVANNILLVKRKPNKEEITNLLFDKSDVVTIKVDSSEYNKIKLEYMNKNREKVIGVFEKNDIIIKEPNPFSYYTSSCINGYAKGWKRLYPNNAKGLLVSIDAGTSTEGGIHNI